MSRACTVCSHSEREAINIALIEGMPNRRIAAQFEVTESCVRRHKATHLALRLRAAGKVAGQQAAMWAARRIQIREQGFELARELKEKARMMLKVPLTRERVED